MKPTKTTAQKLDALQYARSRGFHLHGMASLAVGRARQLYHENPSDGNLQAVGRARFNLAVQADKCAAIDKKISDLLRAAKAQHIKSDGGAK